MYALMTASMQVRQLTTRHVHAACHGRMGFFCTSANVPRSVMYLFLSIAHFIHAITAGKASTVSMACCCDRMRMQQA